MEFLGYFLLIILVVMFFVSIWLKNGLKVLNITHKPNEIKVGSGKKSALIIYQPTKHDTATNLTKAIANYLAENDYTVTINYPSNELNYILSEYDLIIFGSGVYLGRFSPVLSDYILRNRFKDKKVLIYTVGLRTDDLTDLNELRVMLDDANEVQGIKVSKGQEDKLKEFVKKAIND